MWVVKDGDMYVSPAGLADKILPDCVLRRYEDAASIVAKNKAGRIVEVKHVLYKSDGTRLDGNEYACEVDARDAGARLIGVYVGYAEVSRTKEWVTLRDQIAGLIEQRDEIQRQISEKTVVEYKIRKEIILAMGKERLVQIGDRLFLADPTDFYLNPVVPCVL